MRKPGINCHRKQEKYFLKPLNRESVCASPEPATARDETSAASAMRAMVFRLWGDMGVLRIDRAAGDFRRVSRDRGGS